MTSVMPERVEFKFVSGQLVAAFSAHAELMFVKYTVRDEFPLAPQTDSVLLSPFSF